MPEKATTLDALKTDGAEIGLQEAGWLMRVSEHQFLAVPDQ